MSKKHCLVAGAGGFIGHHLVKRLKAEGHYVVGADLKHPEFEKSPADEFVVEDLRRQEIHATKARQYAFDEVYQLAADMGGMGYVTGRDAQILHSSGLINQNMIEASRRWDVGSYLFTSSACVYPEHLQGNDGFVPVLLHEGQAIPAAPQDGYGWEKLMGELLCRYYHQQYGLNTHVVRLFNIYGPMGTFQGGKEKSPAALCRKVALATSLDAIDVWGDGQQIRTYCYIDDAVEGIIRAQRSECHDPINIGSDHEVTIDQLADIIIGFSGKDIRKNHVNGPIGVYMRSGDFTKAQTELDWKPAVSLEYGLELTYRWIEGQL